MTTVGFNRVAQWSGKSWESACQTDWMRNLLTCWKLRIFLLVFWWLFYLGEMLVLFHVKGRWTLWLHLPGATDRVPLPRVSGLKIANKKQWGAAWPPVISNEVVLYVDEPSVWAIDTLLGTITHPLSSRHFRVDDFPFPQVGTCYCSSQESIHAWLYDIIYRKWLSISLSSSIRPAWKRKHKSLTVTLGDGDGVGPPKRDLSQWNFPPDGPKKPGKIGGWSTYHIFHPESMNTVYIYTPHTHTLCESKPCLNKRVRLKSIGFFSLAPLGLSHSQIDVLQLYKIHIQYIHSVIHI